MIAVKWQKRHSSLGGDYCLQAVTAQCKENTVPHKLCGCFPCHSATVSHLSWACARVIGSTSDASLVDKRSVPRPSSRPPLNGGCLLFCPHQDYESGLAATATLPRHARFLMACALMPLSTLLHVSFNGRSPSVTQIIVTPATANLERPLTYVRSMHTLTVRVGRYFRLHTYVVR